MQVLRFKCQENHNYKELEIFYSFKMDPQINQL